MHAEKYSLTPPSLEDLVQQLKFPLSANYEHFSVGVVSCPDLREPPFYLATEGLGGDEKISDVGGQPNLFPTPRFIAKYSLLDIAKAMDMKPEKGSLIGAGAGPFHVIGQNSELAPNISWQDGFNNVNNQSHYTKIDRDTGSVILDKCPSSDCALMVNLFGSLGNPGPVLKITARKRIGAQKSFTECIRQRLTTAYGPSQLISLSGVFLLKSGKAKLHIMPDFPSQDKLPFKSREDVEKWLTFHEFEAPIVCLSVLHSGVQGEQLGLRMEHTHCFSADGREVGGHYHFDLDGEGDGDVEYEAYFNTAKTLYRIERPA